MATLNLDRLWVNLMATGQGVGAYSAPDSRGEDYTYNVTVRDYTAGRRRAIVVPGAAGTFKFRLIQLTRINADLLNSWAGQLVQVRDNRGRQFFGVYPRFSYIDQVGSSLWQVDLTLTTVTADAGV